MKSRNTMKYLRTDNGLKFYNEPFDLYCKDNGITKLRKVFYTSQQNGWLRG